MYTMTAEAVVFAIHSAIRLSANLRKAYANSLKSRALVLPLPKFEGTVNLSTAEDFFNGRGSRFSSEIEHLKNLHDKVESTPEDDLDEDIAEDYLNYYKECWQVLNGKLYEVSSDDLIGCLRIRQWEVGKEPITKPVQLVAGTLVDIGIDYFNQVPGALNPESAVGTFLKSFLSGVDEVSFAEGQVDLKKTLAHKIIPQLFIATAETLEEMSDEITDNLRFQSFIRNTSRALTEDIHTKISMLGAADQAVVVRWGRLIFRSMIKNAGHYVVTDPGAAIGTGIKESAMVQAVGEALMDLVFEEGVDTKPNFNAVFTSDALDKIVRAALETIALHPGLIAEKNVLKDIIKEVAGALSESKINRPGLLPDVIRLVLVNVAGNLERLMDAGQGDAKHLLVTASREVLTALAPKEGDTKWRPSISNMQIIGILEDVLDEVVSNPQWLTAKTGEQSVMREVLDATYNSLSSIPSGNRLNGGVLRMLIRLGMRTAATSKAVVKHLKWGKEQQELAILNHALDLVFAFTFDQSPVVDKVKLLYEISDYVLDIIIEKHPNKNGLLLTQLVLENQAGVIGDHGFDKETANLLLKASLQVISEQPDLIAHHEGLQNIISGVSGAFAASNLKGAYLLTELIRITIENTAGNLDLLIPSEVGEAKHLGVAALEQILTVLSAPVPDGKWKPVFSNSDLLRLVNDLLDELVYNPNWIMDKVNGKPVFSQILEANFNALQNIPTNQRLSGATVQMMIELSLRTASTNSKVLGLIKWGDGEVETTILNKALDVVIAFVYRQDNTVDRSILLIELMDYIMDVLLAKYPNEMGLTLILNLLSDELGLVLTSGGLDKTKLDMLVQTALETISAHPELVSKNVGISQIVTGVAEALNESKLSLKEMLPEFLRLVLEKTGGNLDLLIDSRKRKQKFILILALQQVLKAISTPPRSGKWKPTLTGAQIHEVTRIVFERILENPHWVKDDKIRILLQVIFKALEHVPGSQPLSYVILKFLIEESLQAVSFRKQLLLEMDTHDGGERNIALSYTLDGLFIRLYDESGGTIGRWTLTQGPVMEAIIEAFLVRVTSNPIDQAEIDKALVEVKQAVDDLNANKAFILRDLLDRLLGSLELPEA